MRRISPKFGRESLAIATSISGKLQFQISALRPTILTDLLSAFPQILHEKVGIVPWIRPWPMIHNLGKPLQFE